MQERPFSADFDADTRTLTVVGVIDELSGPTLRDAIGKYSEAHSQDLAVNLTQVDFMPSLAVGVLATARKSSREAGVDLELVAGDGTLAQRVLTICAMPHRTE